MSAIFEDFVWYTYRLCDRFGNNGHGHTDKVLEWVAWIIDMVAYRQRKDEAIGTIVLTETDFDFDFEPRSKSKGNLIPALVA